MGKCAVPGLGLFGFFCPVIQVTGQFFSAWVRISRTRAQRGENELTKTGMSTGKIL